jgi:sodium-dependent phosphate cotransporter
MDATRPPITPSGTGNYRRFLRVAARLITLAGLLYVFLFAISLLGAAFKIFGSGFSNALISTTSNPVIGLMIGLLATSVIQSSSSTTSIVVGMVAAGALTVRGAIPIVMGANMGTTVTNTIVAMASMGRRQEFTRAFAGATMHDIFNLLTILLLFPLEQATHYLERTATWLSSHLADTQVVEFESPVKTAVKPLVKSFQHLLTDVLAAPDWLAGVVMLVVALLGIFLALALLTRQMRGIVMQRAESAFSRYISKSGLIGMGLGTAVTVSVQSSSITTSLLVPMIGAGIVTLEAAFAVTLGANVGTTVTALLASLAGNAAAVTVALVHLLFNATGIVIIYPFRPIRRIPIGIAKRLARLAAERRIFAFIYMFGVFFLLPLIFVLLRRFFQ